MNQMLAVALLTFGWTAHAGEPTPGDAGPLDPTAAPADHVQLVAAAAGLPYAPRIYEGAKHLGMEPAFVQAVVDGLTLLYDREYRRARAHFVTMEAQFPGSAVSAVGDVLVWQALMMENFDYRFDDQYRAASKLARTKIDAAKSVPGDDAWENLVDAVVVGIEAIHNARRSRYLPALNLAFQAIDSVERTRKAAPDLIDLQLADGLYKYWRTAITQKSKALPDFGDKKDEGIAQLQQVIDEGVFLVPLARLALAFSWLEEREYDKARALLAQNQAEHPGNVINQLMLGMTDLYRKDYDAALAGFDHILEVDPKSRRVHYYRGLALQRARKLDAAEAAFTTYLAFDEMEPYQRAGAHFRLGQLAEKRDAHGAAWEHFKLAVQIDGHSGAKAVMDRMKKLKREGKIDF